MKNFFDYPFNNADIIVCFLIDPLMKRFGEKVKKDCHKSVMVYSNTFKIPNLELVETVKLENFGYLVIYIFTKYNYLPMQKEPKILSKISSTSINPVILPISREAKRISSAESSISLLKLNIFR